MASRTLRLIHARNYLYNQLVKTLAIAGDSSAVVTHLTTSYTLSGSDQYGQPLRAPSGTFTSSTPATATMNATTGIATAVAPGTTNISATNGSITTPAPVTLTVTAQVASAIIAAPSTFTIAPGDTQQLSAVVGDQVASDPHTIVGAVVTWGSSNNSIATVNSAGLVTGVAGGTVIITATSGAVSTTCTGTITSPVTTPNAPASVTPGTIGWDDPSQTAIIPIAIVKPTLGSTPDHYRVVVNGTTQTPDVAYTGTTTSYTVSQPPSATDVTLTIDVYSVIGGTLSGTAATTSPTQIADGWYGPIGPAVGTVPYRADTFQTYASINGPATPILTSDTRYSGTNPSNSFHNAGNYSDTVLDTATVPFDTVSGARLVQTVRNTATNAGMRVSEGTLTGAELTGPYYIEHLFRLDANVNAGNGWAFGTSSAPYSAVRVYFSTTGSSGNTTTGGATSFIDVQVNSGRQWRMVAHLSSPAGLLRSFDSPLNNGKSDYFSNSGSTGTDGRWYRVVVRAATIANGSGNGGFQSDVYIGVLGHPLQYLGGCTLTHSTIFTTTMGRFRFNETTNGLLQNQWFAGWSIVDATAYPNAFGTLPAPNGSTPAANFNYVVPQPLAPMGLYQLRAGYEITSDASFRSLISPGSATPTGSSTTSGYIYADGTKVGTAPSGSAKLTGTSAPLSNIDLAGYDPTVLIDGYPTLFMIGKGGTCGANLQAKTPVFTTPMPQNRFLELIWLRRLFVVPDATMLPPNGGMPNGTIGDTTCVYNVGDPSHVPPIAGQNPGYKWGPMPVFANYAGRWDTEWANGNQNGTHPYAGWTIGVGPTDTVSGVGVPIGNVISGSLSGASTGTIMYDGQVYEQVMLCGTYRKSPNMLMVHRLWVGLHGSPLPSYSSGGGTVTYQVRSAYTVVPKIPAVSFSGLNHNQSMSPTQIFQYNMHGIEVANALEPGMTNPFNVPSADLADLLPFG